MMLRSSAVLITWWSWHILLILKNPPSKSLVACGGEVVSRVGEPVFHLIQNNIHYWCWCWERQLSSLSFCLILSVHWVGKIWIMANLAIGEDNLALKGQTVTGIEFYPDNLKINYSSESGIVAIRYQSHSTGTSLPRTWWTLKVIRIKVISKLTASIQFDELWVKLLDIIEGLFTF